MELEGTRMLEKGNMEVDTATLGSGEYIIPLQGGEKQYALCPRMIEFVVSSTKNIPEAFEGDDRMHLDASACMAKLRTFDRKALKASLALFARKEDYAFLDVPEHIEPLKTVVADDDENDLRQLSMYYYVVPPEWNEECGGGISFESGDIPAKRDRLVVLYSASTKCRPIPWKGSDVTAGTNVGDCIEVHLVTKR
jgi:hypothetical protein